MFLSALSPYKTEATQTAVLALVLLTLSSLASWAAARHQSTETKRLWRLTFRHVAALGFLFGAAVIWKTELRSGILALGTATAGFLVTFRENWLSLFAFWTRIVKRQYGLNDFIEVDGVRGKVIDITWLTTVVAESTPLRGGPLFTGKIVHIPNNRLLLAPVCVDHLTDGYALHIITVPLPKGARPLEAERLLLEVAKPLCAPFYDEARQHMKLLEQETALEISSVEPKSFLSIADDSAITIRLRIVVPAVARGRLQQEILRGFFAGADEAAWPLKTQQKP